MKSQVLLTVWRHISCEAAGEFWHWSLSGVKGLTQVCCFLSYSYGTAAISLTAHNNVLAAGLTMSKNSVILGQVQYAILCRCVVESSSSFEVLFFFCLSCSGCQTAQQTHQRLPDVEDRFPLTHERYDCEGNREFQGCAESAGLI